MSYVISVELNELNLDLVERYVNAGSFPAISQLLDRCGRVTTYSEAKYENIEPWIQWVTVHTGLKFDDHGVFRLGDGASSNLRQIWENVERDFGATTAAVCPMNAYSGAESPAFFLPDPWTKTPVAGPRDIKMLHSAIASAVNENAQGRLNPSVIGQLIVGLMRNVSLSELPNYLAALPEAHRKEWIRAGFLDLILTDVFIRNWTRSRPVYSSLFLNAAAHVQHHYMYSSPYYSGCHSNPEWYVPDGADPVGDIYKIYDRIVGRLLRLADRFGIRLLVATALGQRANPEIVFYYRLRNHESFLRNALGLRGDFAVEPRMSRDFLIRLSDAERARSVADILESVTVSGLRFFSVDNRGSSLFVKLAYTHEITADSILSVGRGPKQAMRVLPHVVHVSIENSIHVSEGVFLDSHATGLDYRVVDLREVYDFTYAAVREAVESGALR